jgi:hypothetical protein
VLPRELKDWFAEWVRPLHAAYYGLDLPAARTAYARAAEAIAAEQRPDLREAKRLRLDCAWFIILGGLGEPAEALAVYRALVEACRQAADIGPASRVMARTSELLARLHADLHDIEPLPAAELARLAGQVAEEDRGPNYWHEVGCWAFVHGDSELLEEAYVFFTTHLTSEMADFTFSRLRLMHQLMHRTATVDSVLETLERIEVLVQLDDFRRLLLPVVTAQGLLTPHVESVLHTKQIQMEHHGKRAPERRSL